MKPAERCDKCCARQLAEHNWKILNVLVCLSSFLYRFAINLPATALVVEIWICKQTLSLLKSTFVRLLLRGLTSVGVVEAWIAYPTHLAKVDRRLL